MKIIVLAGGLSNERDVSLSSSSKIANALIQNGHSVLLLDVYTGIELSEQENLDRLFKRKEDNFTYSYQVKEEEPDLEELKSKTNNPNNGLIGKNVLKLCQFSDIVFLGLHGSMGENGQIQATFDILGINYTGSPYVASLLAMDKDLSKKLLSLENIPLARSKTYKNIKDVHVDDFPVVVKPCNNGSSVGVSIVNNQEELKKALDKVEKFNDTILIEDYIKGREFSVGILGDIVLPPIEMIPNQGFYDYKNKYQPGATLEICPAELSIEETEKIQELALRVVSTLKLEVYARIDFIYDGVTFYCLEANTLPGMTPTSLLPQEANAIGITYQELCEKIVSLSLNK